MQKSQLELDKRILKIGSLVSAVFCPIYAILFRTAGRPVAALTCVLSLLVCIGLLAWGLNCKQPQRALQALLGMYFAEFSFLAWHQEGLAAPALWWLVALPPVCLLAGLHAQGVGMALLLGIQLLAMYLVDTASTLPQPIAIWPLSDLQRLVAATGSTAMLTTVTVLCLQWRKAMSIALDRARDEAMEAVNSKARFLANMSHEIRTPLNGLVGAADLLRLESLTPTQRAQLVSLQQQSSKTVLSLVDDILDWSKLKAGQMLLEMHPLNICSLAFSANQLFSVTAFDKGIELTTSADVDVPRALMGDATRLRQIVNNLVSNAVKFTSAGGVHIHVSVDKSPPRPPAGHRIVQIIVSDTGIGITPQQRESLFDEFAQADGSITRRFGGTGLGLAICQDLAHLMGGRIEVDSIPGQGSTFSLSVPMRTAPSPAPPPPLPGAQQLDVTVACSSEGLARHMGTLLRELNVRYTCVSVLPPPEEPDPRQARLLFIDSALLPEHPEMIASKWRAFEKAGVRVVLITPFNGDTVLGVVDHPALLYKPVRRSSLRAVLLGCAGAPPEIEPDSQFDALPAHVPRHVLLAEDNPVNQIVCKAMLTQVGCRVTQADNGQEALDLLERMRFDVVLMDLQMPVMDGLTAIRELRKREEHRRLPRTPVVVMTANMEADIETGIPEASFDGFLAKPFVIKHLTNCLKNFPAHA